MSKVAADALWTTTALKGGEYIRSLILLFWALWMGMFQRFDAAPAAFDGFIRLTSEEWVWAGAFVTVGMLTLFATACDWYLARFAGQALTATSWGWIAGAFLVVDWESSAVPVTIGLSLYSIFGLMWVPLVGVFRREDR